MAVVWPAVSMATPATSLSTQMRMVFAQGQSNISREWPQGGGSLATVVSIAHYCSASGEIDVVYLITGVTDSLEAGGLLPEVMLG